MAGSPGPGPFALAVLALPVLFGGGCAAVQPSAGAVSAADAAALADRLPAVAAGFQRGEARPLARASADGREVAYSTVGRPTAAATVELLNDSTAPEAALEATLADVVRAGPAREMREAGRFTLAAPGNGAAAPLSCAETAGRYGRERVAGLVCTGRCRGVLLRIRVTMPARQPPPADPRAFAEAIAASLSAVPAARPG